MALGTNSLILPLYHPIRLAEDVALIHVMSGGRFILGVAIGYKPEEFEALGLSLRHRVSRFEEQLAIVKRLWTETGVTFKGRHFSFNNVSLPRAGSVLAARHRCSPRPAEHFASETSGLAQRGDTASLPGLFL